MNTKKTKISAKQSKVSDTQDNVILADLKSTNTNDQTPVNFGSGNTSVCSGQEKRDNAIIEVRDLIKNFYVGGQEVKVLKNISLQVCAGDFLVILGPSGCGKSTLLHTILGLEIPTSGNVKFLGKNLYDHTNEDDRTQFRKEHVGMIYQQPNWIKSMSVIENVAFPLVLRGFDKDSALQNAHAALEVMKMTPWENQIPTELSGGQQQRVALARCVVHNPEVIIADEPTGNLDYESGIEVMELLQKHNLEYKKTMIMVTHDIEYVKYATCAIRVLDGHILGFYQKHNIGELVSQMHNKRIGNSQE
ncbi:MAG: ABC transporter ATP-binding protein [Patescibacteria group bacterium]